jgi:hypothetical protein
MITATVIQDSRTGNGDRITTLELEFPRFILAEFNTHRMLSRNAQSSRAVPTKMLDELLKTPVRPVSWGKNQAGMEAHEELDPVIQQQAEQTWLVAAEHARIMAQRLNELGVHKQIANRVTEAFQSIKVVVTATEWQNFFHLRLHPAAQPEFQELAGLMYTAILQSDPQLLLVGEWHTPYVGRYRDDSGDMRYTVEGKVVDLATALRLSSSLVAQVSYRKLDYSLDKARKIWQQLIESTPQHASPVEHQATPVDLNHKWQPGVTHQDCAGNFWSANFRGWVQHRKWLEHGG